MNLFLFSRTQLSICRYNTAGNKYISAHCTRTSSRTVIVKLESWEIDKNQMTQGPPSHWLTVHCGLWHLQGGFPQLSEQTWLCSLYALGECLWYAGPYHQLCLPCTFLEISLPCSDGGSTLFSPA